MKFGRYVEKGARIKFWYRAKSNFSLKPLKNKMAAFKPEVHVSPLADKIATKFQKQTYVFGAAGLTI
jgi:uncharacterized protein YllA (UPF0747 family)